MLNYVLARAELDDWLSRCVAAPRDVISLGNAYIRERFSERHIRAEAEAATQGAPHLRSDTAFRQSVERARDPLFRLDLLLNWALDGDGVMTREQACARIVVVRALAFEPGKRAKLPSPLRESTFTRDEYLIGERTRYYVNTARLAFAVLEKREASAKADMPSVAALTVTEARILLVLLKATLADEAATATYIARVCRYSARVVYDAIDALRARGWGIENDHNNQGYYLTEHGLRQVKRLRGNRV
jgi:hypothetical protein